MATSARLEPVSLHGTGVSVVPLEPAHAVDLAECAADGALHALWYTTVPNPDHMADEIARRLELRDAGTWLPFTVLDAASGKPVGMTNYLNIETANRRVEIGATWYRKSVQRTGMNTECKLLMLAHAFDALGCNVVEFRTHVLNHQSRRAIERLGAKFDGVLRAHMVLANGTIRDSAVYSIITPEWPTVRAHLEWQIAKPR
jgi:RimJ/RimL family protein N-acetyltransferase